MNTLSTYSDWTVQPTQSMAGWSIERALSEREARNILRRVQDGELEHFRIDDKQADPRNPKWTTKGGYRSGPVSVLAVETKPGIVAVIWFIGANWRNSISSDIVWAEELRHPKRAK